METSFLSINGIPTRLVTLGQNVSEKPEHIILIIPGNPGICAFYEDFMFRLKENIDEKYAIWTISHSGQEIPPDVLLPKISENRDLFNLKAQIQHKIDFISQNIDKSKQEIILIGHSIGCKMLLDIMDSGVANVKTGYLLFPTIENMKITPAGRSTWFFIHHIPKLCVFVAWLLSMIPKSILVSIINIWMNLFSSASKLSEASIRGVLELLNPTSIENMLYLAHTELEEFVLDPDYEQIRRHQNRLHLYYGTIDKWVPVQFYESLKENVPGVQAELCQNKIPHAFVLSSSEIVAEIVSKWINKSDISK